ncbi:MAG: lipoyl synthase [Endomicrobiaceae bacterium]|nr:lipoyl synthase [Endomicrobiaceae bacterium]
MEKKKISLSDLDFLKKNFKNKNLHTVCQSARCPNIGECFKNKTATFLILGDICTRGCLFCATAHGMMPNQIDEKEPQKIAETVKELKLKYVVITSVTRDDLKDGGAQHFADTVNELKKEIPDIKVEVLVPDFQGSQESLDIVFNSNPDVFSHNIETVPSLYKYRKKARYNRSLDVLKYAKQKGFITKTGIMLGLGETEDELMQTMRDLNTVHCDILNIGQYLKPTKDNVDIVKEYSDEEFENLKQKALSVGIKNCLSGKYIRSSYLAENSYNVFKNEK